MSGQKRFAARIRLFVCPDILSERVSRVGEYTAGAASNRQNAIERSPGGYYNVISRFCRESVTFRLLVSLIRIRRFLEYGGRG